MLQIFLWGIESVIHPLIPRRSMRFSKKKGSDEENRFKTNGIISLSLKALSNKLTQLNVYNDDDEG